MPRNWNGKASAPAPAQVAPDCDPCAPPGWKPGMPMYRPLPAAPLPASHVAGNPCDPGLGLDIQYKPAVGRVPLCERDEGVPPPVTFTPISESLATPGWIEVLRVIIPQAFSGIAVRVISQINMPGWEAAVEWALWVDEKIVGDPWQGVYPWPDWRPLAREGWTPGAPVAMRARILPEFWSTGATPITSLLIATASLHLYNQSVSTPC